MKTQILGVILIIAIIGGTFVMGRPNAAVFPSFLSLIDTPFSYSGQAGKSVVVNSDENGLEFADVNGGGGGTNYSDENVYAVLENQVPWQDANVADDITVDWVGLQNYPTGCGAGEAVQVIGDTLTCISISASSDYGDANVYAILEFQTPWTDANVNIAFEDLNDSSDINAGFEAAYWNTTGDTTPTGAYQITDGTLAIRESTSNTFLVENDAGDDYFSVSTSPGLTSFRTMRPFLDDTYDIGSSTLRVQDFFAIDIGTPGKPSDRIYGLEGHYVDLNASDLHVDNNGIIQKNLQVHQDLFVDRNANIDGNLTIGGTTFNLGSIDNRQNPEIGALLINGGTGQCPFTVPGGTQPTGLCFNRQFSNDISFYFQNEALFSWMLDDLEAHSYYIHPDDGFAPLGFPANMDGAVQYVHEGADVNFNMMQAGPIDLGDPFFGYRQFYHSISAPDFLFQSGDFNGDVEFLGIVDMNETSVHLQDSNVSVDDTNFSGSATFQDITYFNDDANVNVDLHVLDDIFVPNQDTTGAIITDVVINTGGGKYLTKTSSGAVKQDVLPFDANYWKFIEEIKLIKFTDVPTGQEVPIGVIAEDTALGPKDELLASLTAYSDLNKHTGVPNGFAYDLVGLVLIPAVRDLRAENDELRTENAILKAAFCAEHPLNPICLGLGGD